MTETPDAATPIARYSNPVTQAGYLTIPLVVANRADLSPEAKLVYGYLGHLAWRLRSAEIDPPREVVAADLALSEKLVTKAIRELAGAPTAEPREGDPRIAPFLVDSVRRGQGRTNVYVINDPEMGASRKSQNALLEDPNGSDSARARSVSGPKKTKEQEPPNPQRGLDVPPPPVLAGKQNVPLDVLLEVCSVANVPTNKRAITAAVALNGRLHRTTGKLKTPGIRHAFWEECRAQAGETDDGEARLRALQDDPDRFAALLADRIRQKAATYKHRFPNVTCSPEALLKWWHDVVAADAGLTSDEIRRLDA